jgi:hypothetical protein
LDDDESQSCQRNGKAGQAKRHAREQDQAWNADPLTAYLHVSDKELSLQFRQG